MRSWVEEFPVRIEVNAQKLRDLLDSVTVGTGEGMSIGLYVGATRIGERWTFTLGGVSDVLIDGRQFVKMVRPDPSPGPVWLSGRNPLSGEQSHASSATSEAEH